jgi:hypothetical protein
MSKSRFGLNRKDAEESLESFLRDNSGDVRIFAVKGDWGVGKTHLIKEVLSKLNKDYFYASTFGITSVEDLKAQFWKSKIFQDSGKHNGFGNWIRNLISGEKISNVGKIAEKLPKISALPKAVSLISNIFLEQYLQGRIVFIDDLERRSHKLSFDEVLGFIENLSEEYSCQVILAYNEDRLDKKSKKKLDDYREKVIDYEILLDPTTEENFHLVFTERSDFKEVVFDYINHENVQTNNIRVLKKLRWGLRKIIPLISDFELETQKTVIHELLCISLAGFDSKFSLGLIKLKTLEIKQDNRIVREKDIDLYCEAIKLGWTGTILSQEIIRLVETSAFDDEKFLEEAKKINEREKTTRISAKMTEIYLPYYASFRPAEGEIREKMKLFLDENLHVLRFHELLNLETIANAIEFDLSPYQKVWLEHQINNSNDLDFLQHLIEPSQNFVDLPKILMEKISTIDRENSIGKILEMICSKNSWREKDVEYLSRQPVQDYKEWLCGDNSDDISELIDQCLSMGEVASKNLRLAIIELSRESKLNAMRARNLYKIDINSKDAGISMND